MARDDFSPFLFGVYGLRPTRETVALFRRTRACGVLLLARNIAGPEQTKAYVEELRQRLGRRVLFAIDHEGGWVLRFERGLTPLPGNAALGRCGDERLAYETGRQMALELRALGIDVNLAPVLDVVGKRYNPGIGIRSFGADPGLAGRLGAAMIRGLQDHGVSACAKHFPGKGAATVDAHVERPTIRLPRPEFFRTHLAPFADAVNAGVDSIMTSHVRYPGFDSAIATFSDKITRGLLRRRLDFDGVVMADDLCMGAVTAREPVQLAAVKALAAGHDLLIIAHDRQAQSESSELLEAALEDGGLDAAELEGSRRRIRRLFRRSAARAEAPDPDAGAALAARTAKAAVRVRPGALPLPLAPSAKPLLVLFPDFEQVKRRFTFEGGPRGPERFLRRRLAAWGPARIARAPVETSDLGGLDREIRGASRVLFFCFEAMRFRGQRAVLERLRPAAEKTVACLIRNPWDERWLPKAATCVDSAGYRLSQLGAALNEVLS